MWIPFVCKNQLYVKGNLGGQLTKTIHTIHKIGKLFQEDDQGVHYRKKASSKTTNGSWKEASVQSIGRWWVSDFYGPLGTTLYWSPRHSLISLWSCTGYCQRYQWFTGGLPRCVLSQGTFWQGLTHPCWVPTTESSFYQAPCLCFSRRSELPDLGDQRLD